MSLFLFFLYYALWLVVPIGIFIGGLFVARKERPSTKLKIGLAVSLIPPALLVAAYFAASSTGCSGGDCTGAMIGLGLLAIPVAAIALFGLGMVVQAGIRCAVASVRPTRKLMHCHLNRTVIPSP